MRVYVRDDILTHCSTDRPDPTSVPHFVEPAAPRRRAWHRDRLIGAHSGATVRSSPRADCERGVCPAIGPHCCCGHGPSSVLASMSRLTHGGYRQPVFGGDASENSVGDHDAHHPLTTPSVSSHRVLDRRSRPA
jgi:hypothetical protein